MALIFVWQILSKCNSLFPELFNQLENHSEMQNAENERQVERRPLALPAPGDQDRQMLPHHDRDLEQLPPPPDWSVREEQIQVNCKMKHLYKCSFASSF